MRSIQFLGGATQSAIVVQVDAVAEHERERVLVRRVVRPAWLPRSQLHSLLQVQCLVLCCDPAHARHSLVDARARRNQLLVLAVEFELTDGRVSLLLELANNLAVLSEIAVHDVAAFVVGARVVRT